ncbi:MAG: hypothetical protein KDB29_00495, partial [Planctomycetes bacterium]|nr:hypothetical protein [Planctomycetota bacterium]
HERGLRARKGTEMIYTAIWLILATSWLGVWIWAWTMDSRERKRAEENAAPVLLKGESANTTPETLKAA